MKLYWTDEAVQDRLEIRDFIATDNPLAAARLDELFGNAAGRLCDFPHLGHAGKLPGTHELMPHENYRLVYEIRADTVWVLALVHAARRWPPDRA